MSGTKAFSPYTGPYVFKGVHYTALWRIESNLNPPGVAGFFVARDEPVSFAVKFGTEKEAVEFCDRANAKLKDKR